MCFFSKIFKLKLRHRDMEEGAELLKKLSFHWRLYITYSVIISVVLAFVLFGFYHYNVSLLEKNIREASFSELKGAEERMNAFLTNMEKQLLFFHVLPEFVEYARVLYENDEKEDYYAERLREGTEIQRIFLSILVEEEYASSISFVSKNGNNIHASVAGSYREVLPNKEMKEKINVQEFLESSKKCRYMFPHEEYWSFDKDKVISVYHPVYDMFLEYGLLVYDKKAEDFNEAVSLDGEEFILIDSETDSWYSTKSQKVDGAEQKVLRNIPENEEIGSLKTNEKYSYYYCNSELTGWKIVLKKETDIYAREKARLQTTILLILIGSLCVILCFLLWVSQSLTAPLRELKKKLEMSGTDSDIHLNLSTDNNEVTMLSETIENILNQIHQQNQNLITMKEQTLKAHMNALEAQMNPHFLYNTLSVIGTYGMENGNLTVSRMCGELSNLLRYSVNYQNRTVSLTEELDNIRDYLHIMEMRYEHMLECVWELDEIKEDIQVPKLILQPIIENCFKHGFKGVPPVWKIRIKLWFQEERWYLAVENNGVPFEEEISRKLSELCRSFCDAFGNDRALQELKEGMGIGLKNTMIRLHMYYQGKEHIRFFAENGTTTVEIGGTIHGNEASGGDRGR